MQLAPPKAPPRKVVRKISASAADLRAPDYAKKSKAISKDAPAKKAGVKRPRKRIIHLVGRKTSMFEDPEEALAARMAAEASEVEAPRNRPPPVPQLKTQAEQMEFLVISVQGVDKNIQEIMQNQKSLERVVETKFYNMDMKVSELTTIVR
ncbi:hypothetical protein D1007_08429 [Hordeum vulgare]|nr:hypothetical protein D1007_08429 [Hordeum vulgare]